MGTSPRAAILDPKAHRLRQILRRTRIPQHEAIYIGDEIRDHEAARREGLSFGAVAWGYTRPETLAALSPHLMFASVDEIADRLVSGL